MLYKFVLNKKIKIISNKKMERGKDFIDLDFKPLVYKQILEGNKIIYNFKFKFLAQKKFTLKK